jgi:hypothetical protein
LQDAGTKTEYEVVAELGDVDIVDVARSDVRQPSAPFKYDDQKALEDVLDELAKKDVKSVVNILNDRKQVDVARSVTLDLDVEVLLQRQRELLEAQGVHQVEFPGAQYQPGVDRPALTADNVVDELGLVGESVAEQRAGLQRLRESAPTAQKEVYQRALDELDTFVEWEAKSGFGKAWDAVKRVFTRKAQPERPVTPKVDRVPVSRTDNADSLTGVSSRELDLHIKDKSDAGTSFQSCSLPGFGGSGPVCATTYGDGGRADRYFPPAYERGELEVRDILTNDDGIILLTNEGPILLRENGDIMAYGGRFEENRISLAPDGHIASISESPRIRKQFDDIAKEVREGRRASREVTVDDARVIAARQKVLDERLTANVGDNVLDAVFMNPHGTHDNFIQAYDEISQSNPVLQALHARFFENGIPVQLRNPELPVEYSSSNVFAIYGHGGVKYAVFADESELARLAGKRYNFDTIEEAKRLIAREQAERVAGHETFHVAFDKLLTEAQEDDWLAFVFDSQDPNIRRMLNWLRDSPTYSSGNAISHADEVLAYRLHYHTFGVAELKQVDFPAVPGEIDMFKRLGLLPDDFVPPAIVDDVVDVAAPRRAVPDTLPIEAAPSCSICVNVGGAIRRSGVDCPCITLSSSIKDNPSLLRLTEDAVNDQAIERELNNLIKQLSRGNFEAGLGRPGHISGTSVFYLRGRNGGRLYYRKTGENQYQIVAKSAKGRNQDQVINKIKDDYKT